MADFAAKLTARQDAISALTERAAAFLVGSGVDARAAHHVALVLDELLTNVAPTAIWIGGINSSASVQVTPVVILAARLGVGRAYVSRHRDPSYRQRGQEPEDSKAPDCLSMFRGGPHAQISS